MNNYYDTNMFNAGSMTQNSQTGSGTLRMPAPPGPRPNFPGGYQQQIIHNANLTGMPPPIHQTAPAAQPSLITPESLNGLMEKSITELTVADIIQINMISNDPLWQRLSSMESDFLKKFQAMEDRMNILDNEKSKLEEENSVLRSAVINMQKSLNRIDSDVRNKNVIITGLPEVEIQDGENGNKFKTDKEKIKWLLDRMENDSFEDQIDTLNISRLGEEKEGYNRVVKIILPTVEARNEFLKNTSKMKDAPNPWNKVFVKKDQHPVYIAENNRLRKKASDLRKTQGYENKEIKIFNGKVLVDNVPVDRNMFFH